MGNKIVILNGSPRKNGNTSALVRSFTDGAESVGNTVIEFHLDSMDIHGCKGCFGGHSDRECPCVQKDDMVEIYPAVKECDVVVLASPLYYWNMSGQLRTAVDRLFYCSESRMAGKLAASVVSCRRGGASAAFDRLNKYFTICNMHIVGSQYWNQVHGFTPDDVRKDGEGLQTMRTLAKNMAWLLKNIDEGRKQGISAPIYEERIHTHFI